MIVGKPTIKKHNLVSQIPSAFFKTNENSTNIANINAIKQNDLIETNAHCASIHNSDTTGAHINNFPWENIFNEHQELPMFIPVVHSDVLTHPYQEEINAMENIASEDSDDVDWDLITPIHRLNAISKMTEKTSTPDVNLLEKVNIQGPLSLQSKINSHHSY